MKLKDNERAKEFLACLGNGKSIHQIESEEYLESEAFLIDCDELYAEEIRRYTER